MSEEGVTYDDWMSDSDALMWHIERDPLLRSTVTSVWVLDGPPDMERFDRTMARAVAAIPRLRQRAVADPVGIAPPRWQVDPHFDPHYHVRQVSLGGEGSLRDLLDLAAPIAMQAFDKDRPLWELHIVGGMPEGRAGVVMKLHHAVSDGMGLVRMTEHLVERGPDERPPKGGPQAQAAADPPHRSDSEHLRDAMRHRASAAVDRTGRVAGAFGRGLARMAQDPLGEAGRMRDTVSSMGRMLKPISEPLSPVMDQRSLTVRFDAIEIPLEQLRGAAKAAGGTLNDAFVAGVTGGLRRYHEQAGRPVEELRMNMPINVRDGEKASHAGNQFVPARFTVPIAIADPVERMKALHGLVHAQRNEPALPMLEEATGFINRLGIGPATRVAGSMMKALDFVTSNVPGPRRPVWVSGGKIEQMIPFGPLAGAAANVTLFSYDGRLQIGVNTDAAAVTDPAKFTMCLEEGFGEVLDLA
jgi:WS/DGAT/MGAT family acyltransferase